MIGIIPEIQMDTHLIIMISQDVFELFRRYLLRKYVLGAVIDRRTDTMIFIGQQ